MPLRDVAIPTPQVCCLCSPRMRGLWSETCARGTNAALVDLLAFARARLDIYANTVSQINYLSHSLTLRGTWSRHADPMSSMYRGMEANRLLMGLDNDGYLHENNQVGWFKTDYGATSAQFAAEARAARANGHDPATLAQIASLKAWWWPFEEKYGRNNARNCQCLTFL